MPRWTGVPRSDPRGADIRSGSHGARAGDRRMRRTDAMAVRSFETDPRREPGTRPGRRRTAGWLRTLLGGGDGPVNAAVPWLALYMGVFLIRPWESLVPSLQAIPFEKVVALVVLARVFVGREWRWRRGSIPWAAAGFLAALLVATALALEPGRSWATTSQTAKTALFALAMWGAIRRPADMRGLALCWVGWMALYQSKALWEYAMHGRGVYRMGIWRLIGIETTYGDPNTFAAKTVLVMPFLLALWRTEQRRWLRWVLAAAAVQSVAVVVLTGSRAGLIGLAAWALAAFWSSRRRWRAALALGAAALVLVIWIPDPIVERYQTLLDPELNKSAHESAEGRRIGLLKGWALFKMRPLAGVGPNCFTISHLYLGRLSFEVVGLQPHNLPGQLLGETGLIGLVGFAAFCAACLGTWGRARHRLRRAARSARGDPAERLAELVDAAGASFLLMLLFGVPGHNLYEYNWFWLGAFLGAGAELARDAGDTAARSRHLIPTRPRVRAARRGGGSADSPSPPGSS